MKNNTKTCKICGKEKALSCFYVVGTRKDGSVKYRGQCKSCYAAKQKLYDEGHKEKIAKRNKLYHEENKEEIAKRKKLYNDENKEEIKEYNKLYYDENKEEIAKQQKIYYEDNKEDISKQQKLYYEKNKEEITKQQKSYREENKEEIANKNNEYVKERRKTDTAFRLRHNISWAIWNNIKNNGGSKSGQSCMKKLGYTIDELKEHIENLFEPWMTWENWGVYDKKTWNEDDVSTWKWQLDHIKPHSDFDYTSMEDEKFKKCWDLSNLRPLKATENHDDGVKRTRHSNKKRKS